MGMTQVNTRLGWVAVPLPTHRCGMLWEGRKGKGKGCPHSRRAATCLPSCASLASLASLHMACLCVRCAPCPALQAIPLLTSVAGILMFFLFLYSVMAVQLFSDTYYHACMSNESGLPYYGADDPDMFGCGGQGRCPTNYTCQVRCGAGWHARACSVRPAEAGARVMCHESCMAWRCRAIAALCSSAAPDMHDAHLWVTDVCGACCWAHRRVQPGSLPCMATGGVTHDQKPCMQNPE